LQAFGVPNATLPAAPPMLAKAPGLANATRLATQATPAQRAPIAMGQSPFLQALMSMQKQMPQLANNARSGVNLAAPQTQMPNAWAPEQTLAEYKVMLARIVAFKRWRMAYYYIFSTRFGAFAASMPAKLSPEMAKMKTYLTKSALFLDILANWEISGFIYCVLLSTWASAPLTATSPPTAYVSYYQGIKTVYSFWTWTYFLTMKDYMALFPEAFAKVDAKLKHFVDVMATYACGYAFNEWHVGKMMGVAAMTETSSPLAQASLASFYWDETFIKTVMTLYYFNLWSWSYPDVPWFKTMPPFLALSLPWIAMTESYWESSIASLQEQAAFSKAKAAAQLQGASK